MLRSTSRSSLEMMFVRLLTMPMSLSDNTQRDGILRRTFAGPAGLDDTVAETATQFGRIRTVGAVNLDAAADGDEPEDTVAIDGITAAGQLVVDALQVAVDDKHVVVLLGLQLLIVEYKLLGRTRLVVAGGRKAALLLL